MMCRQTVSKVAIAILLLTVWAGAALANGQAKPGAASAAYTGAARSVDTAPVSTARFSLEFVGADIVDVVQALANQSGVNIVSSGSVTGKTSMRLRNVTLEQALTIVTKVNGLDYAWVDAAYVVGTPEEIRAMKVADLRSSVVVLQHIQPEYAQTAISKLAPDVTVSAQKGVRSVLLLGSEASLAKAERVLAEIDVPAPTRPRAQVVPVRYLKADQLASLIQASVPDCTVQPGPQENSLLVTANEQQWETIKSVCEASDTKPTSAQTVMQIYCVKYAIPSELQASLKELLPDLNVSLGPRTVTPVVQQMRNDAASSSISVIQYGGNTSGGGSGGGGGGGAGGASGGRGTGVQTEAAPVTNLVLSGAPWTVERGMQLLQQLDKPSRQIHISATVTEVNRDDLTRLGIDWTGLGTGTPFTIGEPFPPKIDPKTGLPTGEADPLGAVPLPVGRIMRTAIQWTNQLHALEEKGRARILSNPSITVLDGRQTALHTGDTILYSRIAAIDNGVPVYTVESMQVGVTLTVNPRSNDNGEVTLTLLPSVAAISGWVAGLPQTTERAVATTVRVKSGETCVIAGLVSDEDHTLVTKVPFLGNIPLVGELFKYRRKEPTHTEILIFVTPTIVEG